MKAVILAGGFGTRISEQTDLKPKPMIEIGGQPILWHIMKIYSFYGINEFIVCCGYKGYLIKEYFKNYFLHCSDVTFDLKDNSMQAHKNSSEPWKVTCVDTGLDTMTGGRLKRVEKYLKNGLYIDKSLFPEDKELDNEYGSYMHQYLEEYKQFKMIQLKKNIVIKSFPQKNPIKKINPILKNISCFNEYLRMDYIMIEIEIPFIKDKNVYIVSKKDKKILKRGYTNDMNMPCTI